MKRYILTGAPSSGKSTLIHELENKNYFVIHESATDIMQNEQAKGALAPWNNIDVFISNIVDLQKIREKKATLENRQAYQFFDRSPICTYALCLYMNYTPPLKLMNEIQRICENNIYDSKVFFIENLGFCEQNEIRKIDFNECLKFEKLHKQAYQKFGFECFWIPALNVTERVKLILNNL